MSFGKLLRHIQKFFHLPLPFPVSEDKSRQQNQCPYNQNQYYCGNRIAAHQQKYSEFAEDVSKQASEREVIAMQIERKAEDCYKAEYARRHLGECYEGRISGVTQRGLFIELENGVEGFVPASSLTATGTMLTEGVRLSDPVSGKNWNLGDTMMITIVRADVNLGKIDFEVAPESAKQ